MNCSSCHHLPSCRYDTNGFQCYCKCHDVADAAADLLKALTWYVKNDDTNEDDPMNKFWIDGKNAGRAAIAKAEGVL